MTERVPGIVDGLTLSAKLRALLIRHYHTSIVRRVGVLLVFIGPAFVANLLVYYFTARILSPQNFGLFYVAGTIGNVVFSGSLVLNIFFTRYLVLIDAKHGEAAVAIAMYRIQRMVGLWGGVLSLGIFAVLLAAAKPLGVQSPLVVLVVVFDTYVSYVADLGRAFLQSRRQTRQLGTYTLVWMVLRLLLCVLASFVVGTVWATLLGSAMAALVVFAGFQVLLARAARTETYVAPPLPAFASLVPVALGYGLLIVISNLDILLTYFVLAGQDIGVYSASSVFPKGILVATMPVSQMLFAIIMGDHASAETFRKVVRKTVWAIFALTIGIAVGIWAISPWMCGGAFGLRLCESGPLHFLLLSAVFLSLLRITVLVEFARERDWLILWLVLPTVAFLLAVWLSKPGIDALAFEFAIFSVITLVFFTIIQWIAERLRHANSARHNGLRIRS